jgi:hypothetical protein
LLALGIWWTHTIRHLLFKHSFDPKVGLDLKHSADGQWIMIGSNFSVKTFSSDMTEYTIAVICTMAVAFMIYRLIVSQGWKSYPIACLIGLMTASVWVFARVIETRVWLDFLPFGIFYAFTAETRLQQTLSEADQDFSASTERLAA